MKIKTTNKLPITTNLVDNTSKTDSMHERDMKINGHKVKVNVPHTWLKENKEESENATK